jgi:hypothetical protein
MDSHPQAATGEAASAVDQVADLLTGGAVTEETVSEEVVYPDDTEETIDESEVVEAQDSEDVDYDDADDEPYESHDAEDQDDDGLEALAAELGLDGDRLTLSEDGDVLVKLKVNGRDETVDLKEAIAGTQFSKANDEKARTLAEERKTFESERQQVAEAYQTQLQQIQGLGEMLQNKLTQDFQSIDWDRLRVTDPAEWAAKQQEFAQRNQELQQAGQMLGQQMRQQQEQQAQVEAQERQQILQSERQLMIDSNPEWADEDKMKAGLTEIVEYAKSTGFSDEELQDVIYSRHVNVLKKAMLYDQGKTVAEKKAKRKAPRMQRASNGRFVSKKENKVNKLVERAKAAKGANKREAQADAVTALLLGE